MSKLIVPLFLLLILVANFGWAATDVNFNEGGIAFTLPDSWEPKGISDNRVAPDMSPSDPLFFRWKRAVITDKAGKKVSAGMNVIVYNVPPDADIVSVSDLLMHRRNWSRKEFLTAKKDGLKLPNWMGYLTEYSPRDGLMMKVFVVDSINNGKFVEVSLSATEEVFPQVESEFRAILKSLRLTGVLTENKVNTSGATINFNRITIPEIGISMNLPQSWPKQFRIITGSPNSMTTAYPFIINMRRNGGGTEPGTFSVMSITMHNLTKLDRFGTLFQNNKLIGTDIYSHYMQRPNHENIEFREVDDGSQALMYGQSMLFLNHAPTDKHLPSIHIPNSIGFVGARKIGNVLYTTYEVYAVNKDRMAVIVIAVPTSGFSELKSEMDEITQRITYEQ
jgi:hypothetical protein